MNINLFEFHRELLSQSTEIFIHIAIFCFIILMLDKFLIKIL